MYPRPESADPKDEVDAVSVTVGAVVAQLERVYPPSLAEAWDSVGLVCGDPQDPVDRVLVCVDVTDEVVDEALATGVGLIVAHHPLLLRGVDSVAADRPKGRIVHRLIRGGCALFTAHTNADKAVGGVNDVLAELIGLRDTVPLEAEPVASLDKWVVMVPEEDADTVGAALFAVGAGALGDYRDCAWQVVGTGQFRPVGAARPAIGEVDELTRVTEARLELVAPRSSRTAVLAALREAHPYEEPAFDIFESAPVPGPVGLGRVGELAAPMTLRAFVEHVAARLPAAPWGIRAAGDPELTVSRVAVCGGAGDSLLGAAAASGAQVYLTGDLRHHPVDEQLRTGGPALVDAGHWASEFPWCAKAAELVTATTGIAATVYDRPTDPFVLHAGFPDAGTVNGR